MSIIDLEKSLSELHKELERLTPATKLAEKAVETVNLAKAIPERHQQLIQELKSIFVNPDDFEKKEFVNVYSSITNLMDELQKVKEAINEYAIKIRDLVEYLKDKDIPSKLDAINFQLTSINNSLLTVQGQLNAIQSSLNSLSNEVDSIRRNTETIISDVKLSKKTIEEKINSFESSMAQRFEVIEKSQYKQTKKINLLTAIVIALAVISIIGTIVTILVLKNP